MKGYLRIEPVSAELMEINGDALDLLLKDKILKFNKGYQLKVLKYFAGLKIQWQKDNPAKTFPGLCAEVDSVTGVMRHLDEQRAWSWGDARGLGLWCYYIIKDVIPSDIQQITLLDGSVAEVNLKEFYNDYVDLMYDSLVDRFEKCGGRLPHLVDIDTNEASDDPRNLHPKEGEITSSHTFAINAFFQYGFLRDNEKAIELGWKILDESFHAAHENRYVDHLTQKRSFAHSHSGMTCVGAVVDCLKTIEVLEGKGITKYSAIKADLISRTRWTVDLFCQYHWDASRQEFSEYLHPITKLPFVNERGHVICDPGHAAEGAGFFAELSQYMDEDDKTNFKTKRENIIAILEDVVSYVDKNGYTDTGIMCKHFDLLTVKPIADIEKEGKRYITAPWWNVRETAAAALKLFQLTGNQRMWDIYKRAFNATYKNYPNAAIGGLMLQTLDTETMQPLPFPPATGNLDPMHSPRAREREIEALLKISV